MIFWNAQGLKSQFFWFYFFLDNFFGKMLLFTLDALTVHYVRISSKKVTLPGYELNFFLQKII